MAEDGQIDIKYPLTEIDGGYRHRTRKNAEESDGTVVFYKGYLEGGTEQTVSLCMKLKKPYKLIDIELASMESASEKIIAFVNDKNIETLNVAGPRLSKCPAIYQFVRKTMNSVVCDVF